jgi:Na+-translocating ferredoxin:NAD+ oxidoreductase RnfD subunit
MDSKMILPKKNDIRFALFGFLFAYVIYALIVPSFTRSWQQFVVTFLTCGALDYLILRIWKKVNLFPFSSFISALGIFLLCDSPYIWPYFVVSVITVLSKHLIKVDGKHIFNPNNISLVIGWILFNKYMTLTSGGWGGVTWLAFVIICLGFYLIIKAKMVNVTLAFTTTFIIGSVIRSLLLDQALMMTLAPITGPAFFLYAFHQLTDPATVPRNPKIQIFYGVSVGIMDTIFRYNQNKFAPFLALCIMLAVYPVIKPYVEKFFKADKKLQPLW